MICNPTSGQNASKRARRGRKIKKGTTNSMANISTMEVFWNHSGKCWMYQPIHVGKGFLRDPGGDDRGSAQPTPGGLQCRKQERIVRAVEARRREDAVRDAVLVELAEILLDDGWDVPGGEGMQVERVLDGNAKRFVGHGDATC